MPTPVTSRLAKCRSEDEFEDMTVDILSRRWRTTLQRNGRRGQRQQGVDIFGTPRHLAGAHAGVQCKNVEALTATDVADEATKAEAFVPPLSEYWIVTSLDRDSTLQAAVRALSEQRREQRRFPVTIWFWQDLEREIAGHPDLLQKYYAGWTLSIPSATPMPEVAARPAVDWDSFFVRPTDTGPRSSRYLWLSASPHRSVQVTVDGDLLDEFRTQVEHAFGVADPTPPPWPPHRSAVDLLWRHPSRPISRHWRRAQDGSAGYATSVESAWQPGNVSLWEIALDCLMFFRLIAEVLPGEGGTITLDFQPGALSPNAMPLDPSDQRKAPLAGLPYALRPADDSANYGAVKADFEAGEITAPFPMLARILVDRWRVMFNLPALRAQPIAEHLEQLATSELRWRR